MGPSVGSDTKKNIARTWSSAWAMNCNGCGILYVGGGEDGLPWSYIRVSSLILYLSDLGYWERGVPRK